VAARLARMDRLSRHGPWTLAVLRLIERHAEVAASKLAPRMKRETRAFKADVRKLKELGLTVSHDVGYSLSPRGRAFLARTKPARHR
jgi:Mn-dependent DtxR family transcriptional regulator